jgi:tRNA(fMet)-specific endonuclease VapC
MKYLLDTNACIRYLNGRAPLLITRLEPTPHETIVVSAITRAERYYGAVKSQTPERSRQKQDNFLIRFKSLPFDDSIAEHYGHIRASLEKRGLPISFMDMQIAAIALFHNLILVTHNTGEFSRIEGLRLEDWEV